MNVADVKAVFELVVTREVVSAFVGMWSYSRNVVAGFQLFCFNPILVGLVLILTFKAIHFLFPVYKLISSYLSSLFVSYNRVQLIYILQHMVVGLSI